MIVVWTLADFFMTVKESPEDNIFYREYIYYSFSILSYLKEERNISKKLKDHYMGFIIYLMYALTCFLRLS